MAGLFRVRLSQLIPTVSSLTLQKESQLLLLFIWPYIVFDSHIVAQCEYEAGVVDTKMLKMM